MTILVIDDESMILRLAENILVRAGQEVITSESGEKGIALYAQSGGVINLILPDLMLQNMSGLDVLSRFAKSPLLRLVSSQAGIVQTRMIFPKN